MTARAPGPPSLARAFRDVRLGDWVRVMNVRPLQLGLPMLLSLGAAALDGVALALLVPMAVGVTTRDLGFVREWTGFSAVLAAFPSWFGPAPGSFGRLFVLIASAAFTAALLRNVVSYASYLLQSYWNGVFLRNANDFILRRHLGFGKLFFDRANQGRIQAILGSGGEVVDLVGAVQRGAATLFTLAAYLVVMLWVSWKLTAFLVCFFPVIHASLAWLFRRIERRSAALNEATLQQHATAFNILSCVPLFQAHSQEEAAQRAYAESGEKLRRLHFRLAAIQGLTLPVQETVLLLAILATIALLAFVLGERAPGELATFLVFFYVARLALPKFAGLHEIGLSLAAKRPRLRDLASLFDDEDKHAVPDGTLEFEGLREGIEVRDLTFAYPGSGNALAGVTTTFARGEVTALVGPSGSGKSTLVHLLLGFYAAPAGSLRIDGRDISLHRWASLRRRMAVVSQDLFVFNDTVRANVALGRAVTDAEIWRALGTARLAELVATLPQGLETQVGDRGMKLSGGERQRLAIARALLLDSEILVLDEATSALDSGTERLIQQAIEDAFRDRTAIVIAHRLSTVRNAHKVVVLEKGRLVEEGPPQDLLDARGAFYRACQEQQFF